MELFALNSPEDLLCRGFSREEIVNLTGVDVGYNGAAFKTRLRGVDRTCYKILFIVQMCDRARFSGYLADYGRKLMSHGDVLRACGLGSMGTRLSLRRVSAEMGCADEYAAAHLEECAGRDEARRRTNVAKYGVEYVTQVDDVKTKIRTTHVERYGGVGMASPELAKKTCATMTSRYGGVGMSSGEIKDKVRGTMLDRYGVEYTLQSSELLAKQQATMVERYGATTTMGSGVLRKHVENTCVSRYGVKRVMDCPEIRERAAASLEAWNKLPRAVLSEETKAKIRDTMLRKYGVECVLTLPRVRERAAEVMFERYGCDNPGGVREFRSRITESCVAHIGVPYPLQSPDVVRKVFASRLRNGTCNTSESEERLYGSLCERFGEDDVVRQYSSSEYAFACDFYVRSRDLYVELNAMWTHGQHWFGSGRHDADVAAAWREKGTAFYDNAVDVWTRSDVEKRETARRNGLNYVVFWDPSLADAELWFATGCPNGRDWEREYSWLPDPSAPLVHDGEWPERLTPAAGSGLVGRAVRAATWREFYKRELALWAENYDSKWGTVQARLYANRFKYIGKLPGELTGREILRGLNIAGMVDGYSTFDVAGMRAFLDAYRPESIHDPCAGWGERLVAAALAGVRYRGVDVNPAVVEAHARVVERYGLEGVETVVGDSGELDFSSGDHDCVFTCPPYGSREIYSPAGAENLDAAGFDAWWRRVVANVSGPRTRVFAYQVDAAHRDGMNAALVDAGWRLDREIPVGRERVSHMSRARGATSKRNYESVQVFVR